MWLKKQIRGNFFTLEISSLSCLNFVWSPKINCGTEEQKNIQTLQCDKIGSDLKMDTF